METSREAQAQSGLTLYFLGKSHAGLRKLSAYYRQRGFQVHNVAEPAELDALLAEGPVHAVLIDLQSRNDVSDFMDAMAADPRIAAAPTIAIISSTTDEETAAELLRRCQESVSWPLKATDLSSKLFQLLVKHGRDLGIESDARDHTGSLYRGKIQSAFLRILLQLLYLGRQDGVVTMESEGRRGNLWFKEGKLIDAQVGALDWEESLDLIRRFTSGSYTITFQVIDRKRFIERNALQWLTERETAEEVARSVQEEDGDLRMSFVGIDADDDYPSPLGDDEPGESEAFEITTSTSQAFASAVTALDAGADDEDEDEDERDDEDEEDSEPAALRTLPALRAVRMKAPAEEEDEEEEDEDEEDDEEEDDDDEEEDDDDDEEEDDDDDDADEGEGTVARVSIRIGRLTRDELEQRMRMEALGIQDQPFSGTRIAPRPVEAPLIVPATDGRAPREILTDPGPAVLTLEAPPAPAVEAPKVEAPKAEAPKPKPEAPKVEAPKPKPEAPKVEAPKVEAPKPKPDAPRVEAPKPKPEAPKAAPARAGAASAWAEQPAARPAARAPAAPEVDEATPARPRWVVPVSVVGLLLLLIVFFRWLGGPSTPSSVPQEIAQGDAAGGTPKAGDLALVNPRVVVGSTQDPAGVIPPVDPAGTRPTGVEPAPTGAALTDPAQAQPRPTPAPVQRPVEPTTTKTSTRPVDPPPETKVASVPKPDPRVTTPANPAVEPPTPKPAPPAPSADDEVQRLLQEARAAESGGNPKKAYVLYAQALDLDKGSGDAQAGVERLRQQLERATVEKPQAAGELHVNSLPFSLVFIDGEKVGFTPIHMTNAVPRKYVVRMIPEGYAPCEMVAEVKPGEPTWIRINFQDDQACTRVSGSP